MPPVATITDSKFNALRAKLRELFELDKSDLDFGIYRIIGAKNKEVTEFLDRQLKGVVKATLAAHGAGAADDVQAELDRTIANLRAAEVPDEQIETNKKVIDLRTKLAAAGGAAAADLEADIYNHLLAFFGRYYDEGDFISQRRYKGDTYAIPYSGEEVTLHWANKDQYYIKSGEWHKDYRFKAGDRTVRFKLVEATQEVGNNKEPDDAKRRYILAMESPVEEAPDTLTLRFEFRVPTQADKDRAASGAVAVFGGDYAKPSNPKKGDEREQFCADAEERALAAMPEAWRALVAVPGAAQTSDKPARTLLGKHLDRFSARNTFDYFIHKDLGGFLRRELDFYIKNEVVRLDDLESLPPDHLQRVQGKVKAIRAVAGRLIAFLGALEDFQKKMWLKKKFVLNTNWLVTVDRIPPALRDVVAANAEQWAEWERLGFRPEIAGDSGLFGGAGWGTREYLGVCDSLVVDTGLYGPTFVAEILASEEARRADPTFHEAMTGCLINGENAQSLRLLRASCRSRVRLIYIDPPYNTGSDGFLYRDSYQRSSWLSLMSERLSSGAELLDTRGTAFVSIGDDELERMKELLTNVLPHVLGTLCVHRKRGKDNSADSVSKVHDYLFVAGNAEAKLARLAMPAATRAAYRNKDNDPRGPHRDLGLWSRGGQGGSRFAFTMSSGQHFDEREWLVSEDTMRSLDRERRLVVVGDKLYRKLFLSETDGSIPVSIWDDVSNNANAADEVNALGLVPDTPKPVALLDRIVSLGADASALVLDFFAGSGTTGHAVLQQNRADEGRRRICLIEHGAAFSSVLRPRITKVIFSPDWKDGSAQTHDKGLSALIKYFALESYEDALNNLPAPSGTLLDGRTDGEKDALITYGLDLELGPHLLDLDAFRDPWGYTINAQLAGDAEIKRHRVDLVETFNYLIGLKVHAYGPLERYSADFERAAHADGLGRMKLTGRLRRDARGDGDAPYVFQRVEGELNPASNGGNSTRVLVVWRKLTDDPEKDAAVLDAWMARHRESTRERTEHRDYHLIYINGPVTLPQPTAEIRTVYPTEETFKIKMFEDTDSASQVGGGHG
ncbi:MAG TPA: site-specific DNA-methyltransferase [Phycisphaerales bacterium]|nr:site-specific DNA-methyltransferase [Phycisphaerales bacterium]HMP36706.1 site-specific DNA-methyltransferase [Phycisphaerales bacterium]